MKTRATFALVLTFACCAANAAPRYNVTNLGTLGGNSSEARALNNLGQVTGRSSLANGISSTFLWDPVTGMQDLGASPPDYQYSMADGINDHGDVVGRVMGSSIWRAALWSGGTTTQIAPGSANNLAMDINNLGQIVGIDYASGFDGFLYDHGVVTALPTLGGSDSMAFAINETGRIAGSASLITGESRAVLWNAGQPIDLGTLGGSESWASALSDVGEVVGMSARQDGKWHAFLWRSGLGMTDLGTLPGFTESDAEAINSGGMAVGRALGGPGDRAVLWADGAVYDLNDSISAGSGWVLQFAWDINESGQIAGYGTFNGSQRAFLLTPVPEPSSLIALLGGMVGLGGLKWLRRR